MMKRLKDMTKKEKQQLWDEINRLLLYDGGMNQTGAPKIRHIMSVLKTFSYPGPGYKQEKTEWDMVLVYRADGHIREELAKMEEEISDLRDQLRQANEREYFGE